jgi:hypothetical protein
MAASRSHGQLIWIVAIMIVTVAALVSLSSVSYLRWREQNTVRMTLQISGGTDLTTLATIVRSPLVLKAALQKPGVRDLAMIQNQREPEKWLTRTLFVHADHGTRELHLQLRTGLGADIEETRLLLSAIVDVCQEQFAHSSREPVLVQKLE